MPEHTFAEFRDEDAQVALGMTEEEYYLAQEWNLERNYISKVQDYIH